MVKNSKNSGVSITYKYTHEGRETFFMTIQPHPPTPKLVFILQHHTGSIRHNARRGNYNVIHQSMTSSWEQVSSLAESSRFRFLYIIVESFFCKENIKICFLKCETLCVSLLSLYMWQIVQLIYLYFLLHPAAFTFHLCPKPLSFTTHPYKHTHPQRPHSVPGAELIRGFGEVRVEATDYHTIISCPAPHLL